MGSHHIVAFCLAAHVACARDTAPITTSWNTVVDSTSDTIVARTTGAVSRAAESRLVLEQRIGEAEGNDSVTFGRIRYVAVATDGHVFVHDQHGPTIKLFDSTGKLLRYVGREGGGPGEFEEVAGMDVLPNGQLVLWDASHARVNVYSGDGEFVRQWRVPISGFFTSNALRADATGSIVLQLPISGRALHLRRENAYVRFDTLGNASDTVSVPEWIGRAPQLSGTRGAGQVMVSMALPMAPTIVHTWSKDGVLVSGPSAPYEVYLTNNSMRPRKLQREWSVAPVLPEERSELRERVVWQIKLSIPEWVWNGPDVPATKPAYSAVLGGEDASIWIALHTEAERVPDEDLTAVTASPNAPPTRRYREPNVYDVFAADGRYRGRVRATSDERIMRMRGNRVWGVLTDSLGIQYVARWRIEPPLISPQSGR